VYYSRLLLQFDPLNQEKYEAEIEGAEREDDAKYPGDVNYYITPPVTNLCFY
jgi:hypothetical protein